MAADPCMLPVQRAHEVARVQAQRVIIGPEKCVCCYRSMIVTCYAVIACPPAMVLLCALSCKLNSFSSCLPTYLPACLPAVFLPARFWSHCLPACLPAACLPGCDAVSGGLFSREGPCPLAAAGLLLPTDWRDAAVAEGKLLSGSGDTAAWSRLVLVCACVCLSVCACAGTCACMCWCAVHVCMYVCFCCCVAVC
jgi:hypothetical protein